MAIKAIETVYRSYRFRSRLEARWAVFFDELGIEWEYELEGFDLGKLGWYLPDFWMPELGIWIEVKGTGPTKEEKDKIQALALHLSQVSFLCWGSPIDLDKIIISDPLGGTGNTSKDDGFIFVGYTMANKILAGAKVTSPQHAIEIIASAAVAARQARFEHGQVGAPSNW